MKINIKKLAKKLANAYSTVAYGGDWTPCVRMLVRRGYTAREIETIIRSKWTRWAADRSKNRHGRATSTDLARFLDAQIPNTKAMAAELDAMMREINP